jgi:cyanate permease
MALIPSVTASADEVPPHPYRWMMLGGVWLLYFSFALTVASIAPLVQVIEADIGIGHATMGTVLGAWPLIYIAASAPCGALLDRFGPRRMLFLALLVISLSGALRSLSTSYVELFLSVVVFGIGGPLVSAGAPKVISLWFTGKDRGLAVGIYYTGNAFGGIFALALTNSVMMPLLGNDWRNVMLAYATIALCAGLIWLAISSHTASKQMEVRLAAEHKPPFFQVFFELIKNPMVRTILTMAIFILFFNHGLNNWMPTILQSYGMDAARAGYWASLPTGVGAISALIIPRLATGERRFPIMAGVLMAATLTTLMIYAATMPWLGIGLILQGICRSAMTAIAILILMDMDHGKSQHVGAASGLYFSAGEIGGALGPMSIGVLADLTQGFVVPLFMMTGVSIVLMLLLARLRYLSKG